MLVIRDVGLGVRKSLILNVERTELLLASLELAAEHFSRSERLLVLLDLELSRFVVAQDEILVHNQGFLEATDVVIIGVDLLQLLVIVLPGGTLSLANIGFHLVEVLLLHHVGVVLVWKHVLLTGGRLAAAATLVEGGAPSGRAAQIASALLHSPHELIDLLLDHE